MTRLRRYAFSAVTALALSLAAGCSASSSAPMPPTDPTPTPTVTASAYILPGAISLGDHAFGDEPITIHAGERLRWVNADTVAHRVVADSPDATDFRETGELDPGREQSLIMTRPGTTKVHCAAHPNMTGTLIVRER